MALSIKNDEADQLARQLAAATGESLTAAVTEALRERLARVQRAKQANALAAELLAIGQICAALPELDPRTPDEILGYDEHGLPS